MELQQTVGGPGIAELPQPVDLMSRCAIDRSQAMAWFGAGVNPSRYIADAGEGEFGECQVDTGHRNSGAASASKSSVDTLQEGRWLKIRMETEHAYSLRRSGVRFHPVTQAVR